jgi:predicted enzyme related to lactoylglutathione lyase
MTLRFTEVCIDATDVHSLGHWWAEVLGWPSEVTADGDVQLTPPDGGPTWLFVPVPEGKAVKNRLHFDFTPDDQDAEVARVVGLGAKHADVGQGDESWVVLADPEGNEFCILAADE